MRGDRPQARGITAPAPKRDNKIITIGTWNIRTLSPGIDSLDVRHGEIRQAKLVDQELTRLRADIVALQETRLAETGSIREDNFTFFWRGLPANQPRHHGVGFAIRNTMLVLSTTPLDISERLMSLSIHANGGRVNLICAYAPTLAASHEEKDAFYGQLNETIESCPYKEQTYILGDFNARVGRDNLNWPSVLGHFGMGNLNSNGQRLLELYAEKGLAVTNTYFSVKLHRRASWRHPRSGQWHQIDFILTKREYLKMCRVTRAYHSADCSTDHSLFLSKIRLKLMERPRSSCRPKKKIKVAMTTGYKTHLAFLV